MALAGCTLGPAPYATLPAYDNPALFAIADRDFLWDSLVDVVDDHFTINHEERPRLVGEVLTEGHLDTFPEVGSTLLEPWRLDAVNRYEKWEGTLQSVRRQALVNVLPAASGYYVEVVVFKELEDVPRPDRATVGQATFRNDNSVQRDTHPLVLDRVTSAGWIPLGRDAALEQQMLDQLYVRLAIPSRPLSPPAQ